MDAKTTEALEAKAVQVDGSGAHEVDPQSRESHTNLQWLLAALGALLAILLALKFIAPGFLFGLLSGLALIVVAQAAVVWFVWEKIHSSKEGEEAKAGLEEASPELERQESSSAEGWVWIATKPPDWPKLPPRTGKPSNAPPGWAPQKRQAKLHFNMLMLAGPGGVKDIVKLDGCDVRTVSANGGPERKWSKKFPISIQHPGRTLFANSKELLIYCSSGFEKESWCNSLRYASNLHLPGKSNLVKVREEYSAFIELVRQMADEGQDWQTSDNPGKEAGHSSSIGKWRAKLKKGRGRFASWGSAEEVGGMVTSPGGKVSSPPRKGDSDNEESATKKELAPRAAKVRSWGRKLTFRKKKADLDVGERSQGSSMGESVISEDEASDTGGLLSGDDFSGGEESGRKSAPFGEQSTPSMAEAGDDAADGKIEGENIIRFGKAKDATKQEDDSMGALDGGIRFGNVMFSRFFFDMARNVQVGQMIQGRIERKLARVETPGFMGTLKCTHFDLGTKPPLAKAMRVLPASKSLTGVTVEVDFIYQGSAKLTLETRLDMRAYANAGLFKNVSDKQEVEESAELVAAGLASKGLEKTEEVLEALKTDPGKKRLKGNFHSAVNNVLARLKPVVQHVTEQVSMVPLTLTVIVLSLEGTVRLRLGPPPTDRLWFGFSEMPELELESRPSVGQLNITRNPLAAWMVERLRSLLRDSLVYPQGEDITIPFMMTDDDEIYQGDPPPAWKRLASDLAPPVAPSLVASPKPGLPTPSSPAGLSPGGASPIPLTSGVESPANREGSLAQFRPRSNLQPILFQSPQPAANDTRSLQPGLPYQASQAKTPVGLLPRPAVASHPTAGVYGERPSVDTFSAGPLVSSSSASQPADGAAGRFTSFEGPTGAGGVPDEKGAAPAISSGHKWPEAIQHDSQGRVVAQTAAGVSSQNERQGDFRAFANSLAAGGDRIDGVNAAGGVDQRESRITAGSRDFPAEAESVSSSRWQVSDAEGRAQHSGVQVHDVSREPIPAARDCFPSIETHPWASGEGSIPKCPSDPWDVVAQAGVPLPAPAAPLAFRNGPSGAPSTGQELERSLRMGPSENAHSPQEQSRSFESVGGADVAGGHSLGAEGGVDVAGGNRKAMMLDLGKKFGMSVRERGRKYLEKNKLGSLLNNKAEGD